MAQEVWGPQKEEEVFSFPEPRHKEELGNWSSGYIAWGQSLLTRVP